MSPRRIRRSGTARPGRGRRGTRIPREGVARARPLLRLNDGYAHTTPDLRDEVMDVQRTLNDVVGETTIDGEFGNETDARVRDFQRANAIEEDGVVGDVTWSALTNGASGNGAVFSTTFPLNHRTLQADLEAASQYRQIIERASAAYDLNVDLIVAMGSRESRWGLALRPPGPGGTGDHSSRPTLRAGRTGPKPPDGGGFGRGIMQIDYDWHEFARTGNWKDPQANIEYGCNQLAKGIAYFQSKYPSKPEMRVLQFAVAGYNCGNGRVKQAIDSGKDVDFYTAGHDYSKDVFNRAGWFELHDWIV